MKAKRTTLCEGYSGQQTCRKQKKKVPHAHAHSPEMVDGKRARVGKGSKVAMHAEHLCVMSSYFFLFLLHFCILVFHFTPSLPPPTVSLMDTHTHSHLLFHLHNSPSPFTGCVCTHAHAHPETNTLTCPFALMFDLFFMLHGLSFFSLLFFSFPP